MNRAPRDQAMREGIEAMAQHRPLTENELVAYQECKGTSPCIPWGILCVGAIIMVVLVLLAVTP